MKIKTMICAVLALLTLCSCAPVAQESADTVAAEAVAERELGEPRIDYGRYYTSGLVVTDDGNEWFYAQDVISEEPAYNGEPVVAVFADSGTPEYLYDDVVMGLVIDRQTAIYDALEESLQGSFEVDRTGNTIRIRTEG